jgi:hypothetical protein
MNSTAKAAAQSYTITAYVNVGDDNFRGYTPRAPIAKVGDFVLEDCASAEDAARQFWAIGQKEGRDAAGRRWPHDVRSLSVGDLLALTSAQRDMRFLAIASVGWSDVPEPTNPIVELAGSAATSRPARSALSAKDA